MDASLMAMFIGIIALSGMLENLMTIASISTRAREISVAKRTAFKTSAISGLISIFFILKVMAGGVQLCVFIVFYNIITLFSLT